MNAPKLINHSQEISGLYEIQLGAFKDERGQNFEIYDFDQYSDSFNIIHNKLGLDFRQCLVSASLSKKDVIRGGHGQTSGHKLIQCCVGEIQFFVVDQNPKSETLGNSVEFILNEDNQRQILLPPNTLNFHGCLSEKCLFLYFWENGYVEPASQLHGKWDKFGLPWLIKEPILSERDR